MLLVAIGLACWPLGVTGGHRISLLAIGCYWESVITGLDWTGLDWHLTSKIIEKLIVCPKRTKLLLLVQFDSLITLVDRDVVVSSGVQHV